MENSTPVGIRAHDMQKRITYVNRAFCEMTGWSPEDLIGLKPPFPFWPNSRREELSEKMNRALNSEVVSKKGIEGAILHRNGSLIETRTFIAPLINEKGKQTGWVTSLIDISEPKKIREELAASQDRFTTVLEGLDAALSVVDLETNELLFANRFYRENFGNDSTGHFKLAGDAREIAALHDVAEDLHESAPGIPTSFLYQESESEEIQLNEDGNRWYEVRRRLIPWVDGQLAQLLIATDITIRKEADELGVWEKFGVRLIGVDIKAIDKAEDREKFRNWMIEMNIAVCQAKTANSFLEGKEFAQEIGFPLVIRPSFTLGGSGGGIVFKKEELDDALNNGLIFCNAVFCATISCS
jgi:PAS domain S-box-containing protein